MGTTTQEKNSMPPKPAFKTCPKCVKFSEKSLSHTLHSTLAYSKCRCHRMFQYRLEQYKAQMLPPRNEQEPVPKSTSLPLTPLQRAPSHSPNLPRLLQAPNTSSNPYRTCSRSQKTLCSPQHSFVTHAGSPHASCRLPPITW